MTERDEKKPTLGGRFLKQDAASGLFAGVGHGAGDVLVVGAHVHEAVAGEVEEDDLLLAGLLALVRLVDGGGDGVAGLRSGDDAFGLGEELAGGEGIQLADVRGLDETVLEQLGDDGAGAVVAQAARVDVGGTEVVAQGEHRDQRGVAALVAEVIHELALGQLRAGSRLRGDVAGLLALEQRVAHEGEGDAAEVGAAAEAPPWPSASRPRGR